ncbi:MAG: AAA family ATPase [Inquilinus sp.]|nr:AAA family ATPase [Inquilinus sp.]
MPDPHSPLFVLTGGPGSGKSTVVYALASSGYRTREEVGRRIIQEQMRVSGPAVPWHDPDLYAEIMLSWEMRSFHELSDATGPVFLDRGVPDVLGYLRLIGRPVPDHLAEAAAALTYNRRVFVFPPWPEIYGRDTERKQDFTEAVRTHDSMVETYGGLGYELLNVPTGPVAGRVRFILDAALGDGGR